MIEALKSWVSNVIAIIFFITIVEILIPNGSMKKYIGFVTGILIIITLMSPVVKALGGEIRFDMPNIQDSDNTIKNQINKKDQQLSRVQSQQVMDVYKEKLNKGIKESLSDLKSYNCRNVDCTIYENPSDKLGEIKEIAITMIDKAKTNKDTRIKPIELNINIQKESNNIKTQQMPNDIKAEIVRRITSAYKVSEGQIKIVYLSR
jgi:stage III sporulation protein AF